MKIQNMSNWGGTAYLPRAAFAADSVKPANARASTSVDAVQAAAVAPNPGELKASLALINETIRSPTRNLEFTVDEGSNMNVVKVVDAQTKDVIRQFPSQEALAIAKALNQLQGLLLKEKA